MVVGEHVYGYSSSSQTFGFSSVVAIPHAPNNAQAVFIEVITESRRTLRITADHLLLKRSCSSTGGERGVFATASSLKVGDCLETVDGVEKVVNNSSVAKILHNNV